MMLSHTPRVCRVALPLAILAVAVPLFLAIRFGYMPTHAPFRNDAPRIASPYAPKAEDGLLRVGAPELERQASVLSPYGPGVEVELVASFSRATGRATKWLPVEDKETGFALLQRGEIDVLVGFWGDPPEREVDENEFPPIAASKAYAHFNPVRIMGAEQPARDDQPLPVFSFASEGRDEEGDVMLLDPASHALWLPFMGDEVASKKIGRKTPYRWFWRDDAEPLAAHLELFWRDPQRNSELAELTERYFGFLPKTSRQGEILELADALATRLSQYEDYIMEAAKETGIHPLLLVAAIYQESRFDPDAVSETRVRGIMQLTTATARMLGVDRQDPAQCILGGARYLRDLWEQVGDKAANDWDRWFMALAAYNKGMSNLNRAIRLAREMGKKGDTWADLKQVFPLLTGCRGGEAKGFVERVRYYNFILHGLVALAPVETQDFAPLLGLAVADADF